MEQVPYVMPRGGNDDPTVSQESKQSENRVSRRSILLGGGTASLTLLAGCSGGPSNGGQGTSNGGSTTSGQGTSNGDSTTSGQGTSNGSESSAPTPEPGSQVGTQILEVGETTELPNVARQVADQWSKIGVDWQLETYEFGSMIGRVYNDEGNYETAATVPWGSSPDRIDPNFYLSTFTSDSGVNMAGYSNDQYDELFAQQQTVTDEAERNGYIKEMQTILHEDMPQINVVWPKSIFPLNSRLWNIQTTEFIGARPTGTMSVISAEPTSENDSGRLVCGGQQTLNVPNPLSPSSNDLQYLLKLAYDTPRRIGLNGEAQNWAIESFEYQDNSTIDMTLREGMSWHDGEEVTIDDLKFSFDFFSQYTFPKYDPYLSIVDSTSKQTDRTVRVNLKEPNTTFIFGALSFMKIIPEHIWSSVPDEVEKPVNYEMSVDELVGSGPFQITGLATDELAMETFDDHFYDVAFDEFYFVNRASNEAIRADFEEQNIHMTTASPPTTVTNDLVNNDYLSKAVAPSVFPMLLTLNMRNHPCSSKAFRRALYHATDAEAVSQLIYGGEVNASDGTLVHPEIRWGSSDPADIGPADIDQAKQTLRDAGFSYDGNDNLRYPSDMSGGE